MGLKAVELNKLCNNGSCEIKTPQSEVTNTSPFSTNNNNKIELKNAHITNFTNFSTIKTKEFSINGNYDDKSYIENFYNYGRIETSNTASLNTTTTGENGGYRNIYNYGYISGYIYLAKLETGTTNIVNYGEMGGLVQRDNASKDITIDNYGTINLFQQDNNGKKIHFRNIKSLTLKNYAMQIKENQTTFNGFSGNAIDNSHLVLDSVTSVSFADSAKLILDFGENFEFGAGYDLNKLIVNTDGTNALNVDFDRLIPKNDIYTLIQRGEYFIAKLTPQHSIISNISKANIRTMNNFYTLSNSMIYPRKVYHSQNLGKKNLSLQVSAIPLKSYESFAYRNESINRRIQRQNKRNYNRKSQNQTQNLKETQRNSQNLNLDSANQTDKTNQNNLQDSANRDYYFILTPFVNHNLFFESGRYNLSGLEYGFLTAFSGKITPSNVLGTHFMMSYGSLGDSKDKDLSIKSLNLNVGLNYKLDLVYDMYLKARGDFFYFLNQVKTLTMIEAIKPNNLGFGVSVAYGKDFNFGKGGVLGIEAGLDYKALQSSTISLQNNATKTISETYQKSLYNLIYVDLGMSYNKYFGNFGLNAMLGIKGNITANKLATSKIHISTFNKSVDMMLDNDNFLGYANAGISYVLNTKNFDMEFSLAYYGNFGDRVISNGGGVEFRVLF